MNVSGKSDPLQQAAESRNVSATECDDVGLSSGCDVCWMTLRNMMRMLLI